MSATIISSLANPQPTTSVPNSLPAYFKERRADVQQLNDALKSGDLNAAQKAYNNIVALGNQVLHRDNPYFRPDRAIDFSAIGGALQNGDLQGARQAFAALQNTYVHPPAGNASPSLPAAVVNLSGTIATNSEITANSSLAGSSQTAQGNLINTSA